MSKLSVFVEQFDGQQVRITADGRVSVLDVITAVTKVKNPSKSWKDLCEKYPEVLTFRYNFKFPGKGQKETPVVDQEGLNRLILLLPGSNAADFRKWAGSILTRYQRGDVSLAEEVIDRNDNPADLKRLEVRIKAKYTNKMLNATIQEHGGNCYGAVANINNEAITGHPASEIKALRKVKNTRDGMTELELTMIAAAEELEATTIKRKQIKGNGEIVEVAKDVSADIAALMRKYGN